MRIQDANDQFFKSSNSKVKSKSIAFSKEEPDEVPDENEKDRIWLSVTNDENIKDKILVGFFDRATDGIDPRYDANYNNFAKTTNFYSTVDDAKLSIQSLGAFDSKKIVSLGLETKSSTEITLSIEKVEGQLAQADVYLIDNYLNIRHNLKKSDYYLNSLEIGEYPDRFSIEFVSNIVEEIITELEENSFKVSSQNEVLKVDSSKEVEDIKVYDMLGRMIIHKAPKQNSFNLSTEGVKRGSILFIEAQLEDGSLINKKSIKY